MPTLKNYTAQVRPAPISGGRRASGEDLGGFDASGLARTVSRAANTYVTDVEESESRKVLVSQAEIRAKYAKRLDDAAINGEDLGKIKEELTNELGTVNEGLQTRKASDTAALHAANTNAVFDNQANNIAVSRAYSAAVTDGAKFTEALGQQVIRSPSALAQAEADVDAFAATLTRVSPENKNKLVTKWKQDLNVAAVTRATQLDPEGTKAAVEAGQYSLTADQRIDAIRYAGTVQSANRAAKMQERADADYQERKRDEEATDSLFKRIMTGAVPAREILNDPKLSARSREHLILFQESRAKALANGERRSNPVIERNLWMAINAPEGDPRKIYSATPIFEAVQRGDINTSTANQLNAMVANQKDENNRTLGSRLYGMSNDLGQALRSNSRVQGRAYSNPMLIPEIQNEYRARVEERIAVLRKEGKDPSAVFTRGDKNYAGDPAFVNGIIDSVMSQSQRTTSAVAAQAEVVTFPDGVARQWSGKGDITDMKTWVPANTAPIKPIRGAN